MAFQRLLFPPSAEKEATAVAVKIGILLIIAFASIHADTVELKTGEKIEGVFKQAGSAGVVMEVAGQALTVPLDRVRAIYLGAAATAATASSSTDALDAVKELQSVTTSGISYRDYAPRVLDAKIKINKYLASSTDDPSRTAIRLAMQFYELASTAWGATIAKDLTRSTELGRTLRGDPALMECALVKAVFAQSDASAAHIPTYVNKGLREPPTPEQERAQMSLMFAGSTLGERPQVLWACAEKKIAEAEKH